MSHHHEGVSCDSCLQNSFRGLRYKCLLCYDFDLCATCFEAKATKQHHTADHPMQCILSRADNELYYGGEPLMNPEQPQSYTCPYCCKMGFTCLTLAGHVSKNHGETPLEVICPVCATSPGGDPNHMTENLARHLTLDHHSGPRDMSLLDEGITTRADDARRVSLSYPGFRGRTRSVRRSNMEFSLSPLRGRTAALRDPVDPIADLLLHLSEVRRTASNTATSAFQQFQMQWHVDRRVLATRQHLERLSHHQARSVSDERRTANRDTTEVASVLTTHLTKASPAAASSQSNFLLCGALDELSLSEAAEDTRLNRSRFLQELMMSAMSRRKCSPQQGDLAKAQLESNSKQKNEQAGEEENVVDCNVITHDENEKADGKVSLE